MRPRSPPPPPAPTALRAPSWAASKARGLRTYRYRATLWGTSPRRQQLWGTSPRRQQLWGTRCRYLCVPSGRMPPHCSRSRRRHLAATRSLFGRVPRCRSSAGGPRSMTNFRTRRPTPRVRSYSSPSACSRRRAPCWAHSPLRRRPGRRSPMRRSTRPLWRARCPTRSTRSTRCPCCTSSGPRGSPYPCMRRPRARHCSPSRRTGTRSRRRPRRSTHLDRWRSRRRP